jgi:hypothetical protein
MRTILSLLFLFSSASFAEVTTDQQLWLGAGVKAEVIKELDVEFTQHVRWAENVSTLDSIMPEIGLSYGVMPWLGLAGSYRSTSKRGDDESMQPGHRLAGSVALDPDVGPIELGYRFQWQQKGAADQVGLSTRLRNRAQISLDTDTFVKPLVSYEMFSDPSAEDGEIKQKSRLTAGAGFKITKSHRLKLKYHHQLELDGDGDMERIVVFGYRYGFSLVDG